MTTSSPRVDDRALSASSPLLQPLRLGALEAPNRVLMAPLTRLRAGTGDAPTSLAARHYAQRAEAGLIVAEATNVSRTAGGAYPHAPGLYTDEQAAGWSRVAEAVHARGGRIVVQLWHVGRVAHPAFNGTESVGPSAIAPGITTHGADKMEVPTPRALATDEVWSVVDDFRAAARRAVDAGLDGVEVHGANGYLLHQFLGEDANRREDEFGGSPANRARLSVEVVKAVADEIGADRTGLRLSPGHRVNGMAEPDPAPAHEAVLAGLAGTGLAYLHLLLEPEHPLLDRTRELWPGVLVENTGFTHPTTVAELESIVADGRADAVAVGRWWISNPDLVTRLREGLPLTEPDESTFYTRGPEGYVDYPEADGTLR